MQGRDFGLGLPELLGEQFLWRPSRVRVRVRAPGRAIPVASGSHEGKPGIKKKRKKERKKKSQGSEANNASCGFPAPFPMAPETQGPNR